MDSAKAKVKEFLSSSGQHDTTVHETTAAPVTHENVTRTEHEHVTPALDKEVHKDHYHTSVQPIQHGETLPEQHHHKTVPVESRSFEHDNADDVKRNIAREEAKFRDERSHVEGQHTTSNAATVAGEHRHHHVHETIQPVIQKQTVEPHVVHTTVPVHEVHHEASQHHSGSTLPAMTMEEFQGKNNSEMRTQHFKGEPQLATSAVGGSTGSGLGSHSHSHTGGVGSTTGTGVGSTGSGLGSSGVGSTGVGSSASRAEDGKFGTMDGGSRTGTSETGTAGKPGLMDKLNPKVDANGDGKAGFMK